MLSAARPEAGTDAFASVFNHHHRGALRLAYLLIGDRHQAEDAVSEAFAKVYVQWSRGRVHDVGPYVRRAVVNQVNSRFRRRSVERREAERLRGDDRGGRGHADQADDHDAVWGALAHLPERQRAAVVLRYYEDLSEADTAAILGCSVGTVKSQVSRGLARLRELLDVAEGGER